MHDAAQAVAPRASSARPRSPPAEPAAAAVPDAPAPPPVRQSSRIPCPKKHSPFEGFDPFDPPDLHDWPTEAKLAIAQRLNRNPDEPPGRSDDEQLQGAESTSARGPSGRQHGTRSGAQAHPTARRAQMHTSPTMAMVRRSSGSDTNATPRALQQRRQQADAGNSIKKSTRAGTLHASRREAGVESTQIRTRRNGKQSALTADSRARGNRLLGFVSHVFQSIF